MADDNRGWSSDSEEHAMAGSQSSGNQGNPKQHAQAGKKGGRSQGQENNPGNFANRSEEEVEDAARQGGSQ